MDGEPLSLLTALEVVHEMNVVPLRQGFAAMVNYIYTPYFYSPLKNDPIFLMISVVENPFLKGKMIT